MKAKLKPIILIFAATIVLLGGAWFIFNKYTAKEKKQELTADQILETIVETEPITTNLKTGGFIQFSFKMQTDSTDAKDELTKRDFQVRNIALQLMSAMTEDQVKSPQGMGSLENQMKKQINELMTDGKVVKIYTTNKIIQ